MAIQVVQVSAGNFVTAASVTTTFALPVTNGNGVVVLTGSNSSFIPTTTTDTSGNTYFKRAEKGQVGIVADIIEVLSASGGFTTITVNFTGSGQTWAVAVEVLGTLTYDTQNTVGQNSATQTCGAITTAAAERIVFAVDHSASSITAGPSGFAVDYSQGGAFVSTHNIYSAIQSGLNPTFTASGSVNYAGVVAAYGSSITTAPTASFVASRVLFGPPIPGSPWMMQRPYRPPPPTKAAPLPVPDVIRTYTPPTYGPPIPGAPWTAKFGFPPPPPGPVPPPPPPTPPIVGPGRGVQTPLIPRVPEPEHPSFLARISGHAGKVAAKINALVRSGQLRQTGLADFRILAAAHTDSRDPTVTDDRIAGYIVGSFWLNTATNKLFVCLGNNPGVASWFGVALS